MSATGHVSTIRILGNGATVRGFLGLARSRLPGQVFEVYSRRMVAAAAREPNAEYRPLCSLRPAEAPLFYCCSVDEEAILREASAGERILVAKANLRIALELARRGVFDQGRIYVLSNPSELIAEAIQRASGNPEVYALGLSVDRRRFESIFLELGVSPSVARRFRIGGNHWDRPCPVFEPSSPLRATLSACIDRREDDAPLLERLHSLLRRKIAGEFDGFKPPARRGAEALLDAALSLEQQTGLEVSGFDPEHGTFAGGFLFPSQARFRAVEGGEARAAISKTLGRQKEVLCTLLSQGFRAEAPA